MFSYFVDLLRKFIIETVQTHTFSVSPKPVLRVKKLHPDAILPKKGSEHAAGYDLNAYCEETVIESFTRKLIKTGLVIELPENCYGRVAPRSGLSLKGIDIGAGVIDIDYRGEVGIILCNNSKSDFTVNKGDRIAQLVCEQIFYPHIEEIREVTETNRGSGGFGSTGKKAL
ncbi:012L [Cherax quadricarinatus iridovirus]|uniref:dUTP diphosphatase n=1 Tax=Shrimp hemocyte iridescent virus TaxID=2039780 RepID=A0A291B0X7_9VIRU|nr:012L [Cherax quadricarinatus iridovirus]YP_010084890.1 deoxyuridine 5 -triphosphate nucleotidohydrolase [Shrimp hemocyte iridescent virus]UPA43332.1 deoxyuridine 5 -triphosphate nucleotidohydrolase [Iridovirus CN01]ASZ84992.1 012L [Cherax quadricarinatus iridovirus]ATE87147.1 deoxyuridine 5 -triphosphate nucleotidohydrolase [Shrimp hemocyte iridescent virus]UPA43567.1 deoxyuridine 5 -triphosphate nucleotidohydrolase [Iridovirus CN01]UPA43602.1 deoxyuridine 5 -triphosphate nucleotidohydrola